MHGRMFLGVLLAHEVFVCYGTGKPSWQFLIKRVRAHIGPTRGSMKLLGSVSSPKKSKPVNWCLAEELRTSV